MPTIDEVDKSEYAALSEPDKEEIRQEVKNLSSTGFTQLADTRVDRAIKGALAERDTIYSGNMARFPTLDGDAEEFSLNLSAHRCQLAEGGQPQSESGEGGSTSYQQGQVEDYLDQTIFGRTAKRHIRNDESLGLVRSY